MPTHRNKKNHPERKAPFWQWEEREGNQTHFLHILGIANHPSYSIRIYAPYLCLTRARRDRTWMISQISMETHAHPKKKANTSFTNHDKTKKGKQQQKQNKQSVQHDD